jgi:hypothetical protein
MSVQNHSADKSLIQIAFPQQANVIFWTAILLGLALIGPLTIFRRPGYASRAPAA